MKHLKIFILAALVAAFFVPALVYAKADIVDVPIVLTSQNEKGEWKDWNKGEVHGWVKGVNPKVVTFLQVAQIYLDESGVAKEWQAVNPMAQNIERFTLTRYEIKEGKNVSPSPQLAAVEHEALRIKLEPIYQQVTVYHHLRRAGQPEILEVTQEPYPRNLQLDAERVPSAWALSKYVDLQNNPSETVVSPINRFDKSLGQYVFKGWEVDLYYSQGLTAIQTEAAQPSYHVDAARPAQTLPATGAISNMFLLIGSAAMVILGLVGKRSY